MYSFKSYPRCGMIFMLCFFFSFAEATSDLIICKLSDCTSSAAGGKEIILLCDKVTKGRPIRYMKRAFVDCQSWYNFKSLSFTVHQKIFIC